MDVRVIGACAFLETNIGGLNLDISHQLRIDGRGCQLFMMFVICRSTLSRHMPGPQPLHQEKIKQAQPQTWRFSALTSIIISSHLSMSKASGQKIP